MAETKATMPLKSNPVKKENIKYVIHCTVMMVLIFGGWFVPAGETITAMGMRVIGVFMGLMYGWIFIDLIWPSIVGLIALGLSGYSPMKGVFQEAFGGEIVVLILFFSVFTAFLDRSGLSSSFANWFLKRKVLKGRPWLFISMILFVSYVMGILVSIYATIFILWNVLYKVFKALGYGKKDKFASFLLIGVAYISALGMASKPFSAWSLVGLKLLTKSLGISVDFLSFTLFMAVISFVSAALFVLFGKYILKVDVQGYLDGNFEQVLGTIHYDREQKIATVLLVGLLLALYLPSALPKEWMFTQILSNLDILGCISVVIIIMLALKSGGKGLASFVPLAKEGVPWPMIFLIAVTVPLGTAVMKDEAGVMAAILQTVTPMLKGVSPLMFYIIIALVFGVTTQFLHNLVLLMVFVPLLTTIAVSIGASPIITTLLGILILTSALATPGASSRAGLVFGNSEWIETKQAYIQGIASIICVLIAAIVIGIPLGMMLF